MDSLKGNEEGLEHLPGETLALIQSCDLVIIVHAPIGLCIMLCSSGFLNLFGLIACYTTHRADASDWITLGKPPCCLQRGRLYVERELLPEAQAFRSCGEIHFIILDPHNIFSKVCSPYGTVFPNSSLIWSFCCVRGCRWKMLSFTWWGEVDFGLQSNQWLTELNFVAFWMSSNVLGRLCHTNSHSSPERTSEVEWLGSVPWSPKGDFFYFFSMQMVFQSYLHFSQGQRMASENGPQFLQFWVLLFALTTQIW